LRIVVIPLPVAIGTLPTLLDTRNARRFLHLRVSLDPASDRVSGAVDLRITLDHPRSIVWLHGKGLNVIRATGGAH
jgi:hypothetical protein